ncbi:hypothetical protein ABBQ32_013401 [Trebouxia sp. C0010 RCD-2024]
MRLLLQLCSGIAWLFDERRSFPSDEEVDLNNPNLDAALHQAEQLLGIPPEQARAAQEYEWGGLQQSGQAPNYSQFRQRSSYTQDDPGRLRSALAEREAQLGDLQDQHMRLVQRSQEARQNWEAALDSKDRALAQLEDALVSQKRSLQQQMEQQQAAVSMTHNQLLQGTDAQLITQRHLDQTQQQVASLESALSQAQARLAEHSSGSELRAARAEQDRWRWQSEAEELRALLASRDREIGKMQIKQEELTANMADLKSKANERAAGQQASFVAPAQQLPPQQQLQYQQQQQPQQIYPSQPALMWEQNAQPAECRQSGCWLPGSPGEAAAAAVQLPHLLQKLQRTQEKLESRDASARKYKDAVRALKARLADATAALQISHTEALRLRTRVADLKAAVSSGEVRSPGGAESDCGTGRVLQDRLNQLHEDLASKEKHRKALLEEVETGQEKLSKAQKHADACQAKMHALEDQMEETGKQGEQRVSRAESRAAHLQHELSQAEHRAHQAEVDFASLAARLKEGEGRAADTDRAAREALQRCAQTDAQLQSTERELRAVQKQWSQAEGQAAEALRHNRELQGELSEAEAQVKDLQHQLERSYARVRHLETALHEAEKDGATAQCNRDALHQEEAQELKGLRIACKHAQAGKDQAESRCAELDLELETLKAAATALRQAQASKSSRQAALAAKLAGLQQQLACRDDAIDQLKGDLAALREHHKHVEADWRLQLSRRTAALSNANQRFTELESVMRRIASRSTVV